MAFAADMPIAAPPMYAPPPPADFGGWYLRGDIGFSNQRVDRLDNVFDANNLTSNQRLGFDTAGIFGLVVGYRIQQLVSRRYHRPVSWQREFPRA